MFFLNESAGASLVQVCSKLAPNLHPKLCFCFLNALNMFFYMFFHVVYCFLVKTIWY